MKLKNLIAICVTLVIIVLAVLLALNGVKFGLYKIDPVAQNIRLGLDLRGGVYAVYLAKGEDASDFDALMTGTIGVIRNRLTSKGLTEATVTKQGSARIRVEIPNMTDPNEILEVLGKPAHLEITDPDGSVVVTGGDIKNAVAQLLPTGEPVVAFELNASGSQAFAEATAKNIGKVLTITLDGETISAPTVQSTIPDGQGHISLGGRSDDAAKKEAINLAALIMSGALPLDLEVDEVSQISATLGVNAITTSVNAGIIGLILVMVFMLAVYRLPGLMADIALTIYVLIILFVLAMTPSIQLTLPGIAGILLGIGMAVDANCVIFERFREEYKAGRSLSDALKYGFKNAMRAVADSNITTIIAALVLMYFGTGTIKGFAITLFIGVVVSFFTAIVVTRFLLRRVVGLGITNRALYTR
jgi:protein-export SecD/SecF family membrane protein